jgi:formylglycine-generating enzyme required for sulfatase activity
MPWANQIYQNALPATIPVSTYVQVRKEERCDVPDDMRYRLCDMSGNVTEWVQDSDPINYSARPLTAAHGGEPA